jgi:spore germination cell wall hydrolase CwlJ-like protein
MVASRIGVTGACCSARFWFSAFCVALMPTSIGYQDLAVLIARGHSAPAQWHLIASPFGTVEAATFNYSRPMGTAIPEPLGFQTVNFDPRSLDAFSWKIDEPLNVRPARQIEYPTVDRQHKGDHWPASGAAPAPSDTAAPPANTQPSTTAAKAEQPTPAVSQMGAHDETSAPAPAASGGEAAAAAPRANSPQAQSNVRTAGDDDDVVLVDRPPEIPAPGETDDVPPSLGGMSFLDADATDRSTEIYFGGGVMGSPIGLQSWAPGAEPILAPPSDDFDIKLSALEGTDKDTGAGESVAGKDDTSRLESPAQRLGLAGKERAKAEKCLADAVYFEARGEVVKGQEAVAQVVMNRLFSGYYPHDVCGVVYQNANRHLACQFTFACEGRDLSRIDEPDMWEQAKLIARDTLDGKIWLAEVGHATHYHAYWVHPSWVHEMTRLYRLGVHTFYRPRNWGDGDDEPVWGKGANLTTPSANNAGAAPAKPEAAKPEAAKPDAAKGPQASASPSPAASSLSSGLGARETAEL